MDKQQAATNVTRNHALQMLQTRQGYCDWTKIVKYIKQNSDYLTINQLQFIMPFRPSKIHQIRKELFD